MKEDELSENNLENKDLNNIDNNISNTILEPEETVPKIEIEDIPLQEKPDNIAPVENTEEIPPLEETSSASSLNENQEDEYITIEIPKHGKRASHAEEKKRSRMTNKSNKHSNNGENKKKMSKGAIVRRVVLILLTIILTIVAILGGLFCRALKRSDGNVTQALLSVTSDILGTDDPIFVLLLGVSEDITTELTDTMILCGYNPVSQKAFMLSIPRDTFIGNDPVYAGGFDKINALYQKDVKKTVKAVESLTGIAIDNYVVVKNIAIPNIVSAVGAVEFDVPIDMNYDDDTQNLHIHLKKGLQLIDKDKAEQLLRFRHNNDGSSYPASYGDNDYGRMRTQRDFIKAVVNNLATNGTPLILKNAASTVFGNVDTNMSLPKIMSYIPSALKYNVDSLKTEVLSVRSAMMNDLYFAIANVSTNKKLVADLISYLEMDESYVKKYYKPDIMRGQVTVPPQAQKDTNEVTENTIVDNTVTNVVNNTANNVINNTSNNIVNNSVNNTTNAYTNTVNNNVVTNTVPTENKVEEHVHDFSVLVSTVDATCTADGSRTYKCSKDETTKVETISALGHNFVDGKCTRCGESDPSYNPAPIDKPSDGDDQGGGEGGGETPPGEGGDDSTLQPDPLSQTGE